MYTLQSGQIENALRGGGTDISAKEMVSSLANCGQPMEHRGSFVNTKVPRDNSFHFPSFPPEPTSFNPSFYHYSPQSQTIINIPPWQNIPFEPLPYPEYPQWSPIPYPDWPGGQEPLQDNTVIVTGPVTMGPVSTTTVNAGDVNSTTINNAGDITNDNTVTNHGPVTNNSPVTNNHTVVNNSHVTNKTEVINQGPVHNNSTVYNEVAHNYTTHNHGDTHNYGDTYVNNIYSSGPNELAGDTYTYGDDFTVENTTVTIGGDATTNVTIEGDDFTVENTTVTIGGDATTNVTIEGDTITFDGPVSFPDPDSPGDTLGPLDWLEIELVTDVEWDGTELKKKYRTIYLLGSAESESTGTIVSGTSCPSTPISASASNLVDMP